MIMKIRKEKPMYICEKRVVLFLALLPLFLSVQACRDGGLYPPHNSDGDDKGKMIADVYGVEWQLAAFETREGEKIVRSDRVPDGQEYGLTFNGEGNAGGMNHCNSYGVAYKAGENHRIAFTDFIATEMYCGDESLDRHYADAILAAERYELGSSTLRIFYGDNTGSLLFTRAAADRTGVIELMQLEVVNLAASDRFSILTPGMYGDELRLQAEYSGGCSDHDFLLIGPLTIPEGEPTPITLFLSHNSHGDPCRALLTDRLAFDLTPLKNRWKEVTGKTEGDVEISLHDMHTGVAAKFIWRID